ncbi:MAG: nitroreductase family protein [Candidatus Kapaibacterium sp.]
MAIPTSRTNKTAEIKFNSESCNGCGSCVTVCKDFNLVVEDGIVKESGTSIFGCIGCGHCAAICPNDAIEVHGRTMTPEDLFAFSYDKESAGYEELLLLYQRRRSIREFKNKEIESELIDKIVYAAKTSPMGIPPSDVNVLVINSKEKNREFAKDFCKYLESIKWIASDWFLTLMRPFLGKELTSMYKDFLRPLLNIYTTGMKNGINNVNYDAPLSMYFYGTLYSDPADPIVAATSAMYAAESLGLGTCLIGGVHPFIQKSKQAEKFRKKYGIKNTSKEGLILIIGYPDVKYRKGINRTFASVTMMD